MNKLSKIGLPAYTIEKLGNMTLKEIWKNIYNEPYPTIASDIIMCLFTEEECMKLSHNLIWFMQVFWSRQETNDLFNNFTKVVNGELTYDEYTKLIPEPYEKDYNIDRAGYECLIAPKRVTKVVLNLSMGMQVYYVPNCKDQVDVLNIQFARERVNQFISSCINSTEYSKSDFGYEIALQRLNQKLTSD